MKSTDNSSVKSGDQIIRREFLSGFALAGAGLLLNSCSQDSPNPATSPGVGHHSGINVALIGCGNQGRVLLDSLQRIPGINVAAVVDIWGVNRDQALQHLRKTIQQARGYRDFEELLASENGLHAAIVATPDFWHAPITNACLKAGLHVYCETMMSNTIEGARSMVKTMRETGKLLQIGYQRRSNPCYNFLLEHLVREKHFCGRCTSAQAVWNTPVTSDFGTPSDSLIPSHVLNQYGFKTMHQFRNWQWFKSLGGGPLSARSAHQVDVFNWFFGGLPRSVIASGGVDYYKAHEWFDNAMAVYEFLITNDSCARASLQMQTTSSGGGSRFERFSGDDGSIKILESQSLYTLLRESRSTRGWEEFLPKNDADSEKDSKSAQDPDEVDVCPTCDSSRHLRFALPAPKSASGLHLENFFAAVRGTAKLNCPSDVAFASECVIHKTIEAIQTGERILITKEETAV